MMMMIIIIIIIIIIIVVIIIIIIIIIITFFFLILIPRSFSNMRVRGSSLCDVAVLMVDISHGLEGQTVESLKLVTRSKTSYFIGINKVK